MQVLYIHIYHMIERNLCTHLRLLSGIAICKVHGLPSRHKKETFRLAKSLKKMIYIQNSE